MGPTIVNASGVELCVETFGAPADPAVLLIMGAAASMDWWEDDFCARLAAGPRFVARYDHRDTGRSVSYPPGAPGYTGDDLIADAVGRLTGPDWSDRAAVIDYATELSRACASGSRPFDERGTRALWERVADRTTNIESSMKNHYATEGDGGRWRERLGALDVPALVVHGTEDPLFPIAHGEALARAIPGAELLVLEGAGHELARRDWDVAVPAILRVTGS
jgi:pimeloyl-ACP methyl ester carboxylesterase